MGMVMGIGASRRCHEGGDEDWGHPGGVVGMVMETGTLRRCRGGGDRDWGRPRGAMEMMMGTGTPKRCHGDGDGGSVGLWWVQGGGVAQGEVQLGCL